MKRFLLLVVLCLAFFSGCAGSQPPTASEAIPSNSPHQSPPANTATQEGDSTAALDPDESEQLLSMVQDYTINLFVQAYEPYFEIEAFHFSYEDLELDGDGFALTFSLDMTTKTTDREATTTFPLYLVADGQDTDLFSLYYVSADPLSNKGLPYIPIQEVFPPQPNADTISVPIGASEYFGAIQIADGVLTLQEMLWQDDPTADNGYVLKDLGRTESWPLAESLQISYLNHSNTSQATDLDTLAAYLNDPAYPHYQPLFWVYVQNGQVLALMEQYRP